MATATWFDYNAYMANKLVQVNAIDPKVQYTPETLKAEFEKAGYVGEEGAFKHFEQYGKTEDVAPNALFDADEYIVAKAADFFTTDKPTASQIAEVAKAFADGGMSAWDHYVTYGSSEGVEPSFSFNTDAYLTAKAAALNTGKYDGKENWTADDVAAAIKASGSTVLEHFMANGGGGEYEVGATYTQAAAGNNPFKDLNPPTAVKDPNPGDTLTLTTGVDKIVGTAKDDIINGVASYLPAEGTLNAADTIDGGEGDDTANFTLKGDFSGFTKDTGFMKNVENVNLLNEDTLVHTFNATGVSGVKTYNLTGEVALSNLAEAGITVNAAKQASGDLSISFDAKAVAGAKDALNVGLTAMGTAAGKDAYDNDVAAKYVNVNANGIETLTLTATDANYVNLAASGNVYKDVVAKGKGSLDVQAVAASTKSFDASSVQGEVVVDVTGGSSTLSAVKTGAGDDKITANVSQLISGVVDGGAGNDTLVLKGAGTMAGTVNNIETFVLDGITGAATISGKAIAGLTTVQISGEGIGASNVSLNDTKGPLTVVTKGADAGTGTVTLTSPNALTVKSEASDDLLSAATRSVAEVDAVNVTAFKATDVQVNVGKYTNMSGTITAASATNVKLNVEEGKSTGETPVNMTTFSGAIVADQAKTLTVASAGSLNGAAFSVKSAASVDMSGVNGTITLNAAAATSLKLAADNTFTMGTAPVHAITTNLDKVMVADLSTSKGNFTLGDLKSAATVTVANTGTGTMTLGNLGDASNKTGITLTATGCAGDATAATPVNGLTLGSVTSKGDIVLNLNDVTGVQTQSTNAAVKSIAGNVTILASKTGSTNLGNGTGDITVDGAKTLTVTATDLQGGTANGGVTAGSYALNLGTLIANTGTVNLTVSGSNDVKVDGITAKNANIDMTGYYGKVDATSNHAAANSAVSDAVLGDITATNVTYKGTSYGENVQKFVSMGTDTVTAKITGGDLNDAITYQIGTATSAFTINKLKLDVNLGLGDDKFTIDGGDGTGVVSAWDTASVMNGGEGSNTLVLAGTMGNSGFAVTDSMLQNFQTVDIRGVLKTSGDYRLELSSQTEDFTIFAGRTTALGTGKVTIQGGKGTDKILLGTGDAGTVADSHVEQITFKDGGTHKLITGSNTDNSYSHDSIQGFKWGNTGATGDVLHVSSLLGEAASGASMSFDSSTANSIDSDSNNVVVLFGATNGESYDGFAAMWHNITDAGSTPLTAEGKLSLGAKGDKLFFVVEENAATDTANGDSTLYYVADANNDGIVQKGEIFLVGTINGAASIDGDNFA